MNINHTNTNKILKCIFLLMPYYQNTIDEQWELEFIYKRTFLEKILFFTKTPSYIFEKPSLDKFIAFEELQNLLSL